MVMSISSQNNQHIVSRNSFENNSSIMIPGGQPPTLSPAYVNWSPVSTRKAMKPAGIAAEVCLPSPNPIHFNRPSPNSSPIMVRKARSGGDSTRGSGIKPQPFQPPPGIYSSPKQFNNLKSLYESPTTCSNVPQMAEELHKQKKDGNKAVPLTHNSVPLHLTGEAGHSANTKIITPMSRSSSDLSCSKSTMVEESMSEKVSEHSSTYTVIKSGVSSLSETRVGQEVSVITSSVGPQYPTPWRNAKTPGDVSAKTAKSDAAATAGTQPSWRTQREEQLKNFGEESTSSVFNSAMISVKPQAVPPPPQQQQQQHRQNVKGGGIQQQQQPVCEEAPWRSPQARRKELNKPPTIPETTKESAVGSSPIATPPQVSSKPTASGTSPAASCLPSPPVPPHQNISPAQPQTSPNLPRRPPLPTTSTASSTSTSTSSSALSTSTASNSSSSSASSITISSVISESIKTEETRVLEELQEQTVTVEMKSEGSAPKESATKVTEVSVKSDDKVQPPSQDILPPPPPPIEPQSEVGEAAQQPPKHVEPVEQPLPPPFVTSCGDVVESENQPPPPPPPPKKTPVVPSPLIQPSNTSLPLRLTNAPVHSETGEQSPDFSQEPITSRIQRFEKQSSFELLEKKEKQAVSAKPVGPWVKRTSSGPVQQDAWDPSQDKLWPEPPPDYYFTPEPMTKVLKQPQGQFTSENSSVSSISMVLSQPSKDQHQMSSAFPIAPQMSSEAAPEPPALQHKQLQKLMTRPRTKSTGDFSHSYLDNADHAPMGQEKTKQVATGFPKPGGPSPAKGESKRGSSEYFDPMCDPNNPRVIQFQDVSAAAFKIKSGIMNTPCTRSNMSTIVNMDLFFKKEFNQYTGSFKERGARYTLLCLSEEQKSRGVIAASAGNHALALSYHGQNLGIPVTVVMPLVAPIMKVQACRQYGANILVKGSDIGECKEIALKMAKEQNLLYINGYDHPHILAGQGTMGLEIVEQVSNIDAVVVPVGGAGLIAGVALAVKSLYPHIKVIGVEAEKCPSFTAAMKANKPVYVKAESSLADGLAVPMVGVNAFATASKLVDKVVSVREEWIAIAILRLVEMEKAVVEGAGAAALAALLAGLLPELIGKRVVIPLCGGNIDTTVLGRCLERGLAADGRLVKFTVTVSDRPGGIADLTRLLANLGVSIKDMLHERAWIRSDIFSVEVKVLCETRDHEHSEELRQALLQKYKELRFGAVPE